MSRRNRLFTRPLAPALLLSFGVAGLAVLHSLEAAQQPDPLSQPFVGLTTDGTVQRGLFAVRRTGVSTAPVRQAADAYLASLTAVQRERTVFPVDDIEWRRWNNVHRYARAGASLREMTEAQRDRAFNLMRASLSAKGLEKSRNIMRLNGHLRSTARTCTTSP
jgi:hypothetical protein